MVANSRSIVLLTAAAIAQRTADNDRFDRPWWNIRQAITWLMFGSREKVALVVTGHDGEPEESVHSLVTRLRSSEHEPDRGFAPSLLLDALARGEVQAIGCANDFGDPQELPSLWWADSRFGYDPDRAEPYNRIAGTVWYRLRFRREDLFKLRPPARAESERRHSAPPSDLATHAASLADKRWGKPQQKREPVLDEAESVAREQWKNRNDDHAEMTDWLQTEYSRDGKLPFMDDKLTNHLRKRMARIAREIGKPVKGEKKKSPG